MRNIRGAFVVFGENAEPRAELLDVDQLNYYAVLQSRCAWKANRIMFGAGVEFALPCTTECMEQIALQYVGKWQEELRGLCALIALGRPIPNKGAPEGGAKVEPRPTPRKPPPTPGVAFVKSEAHTAA